MMPVSLRNVFEKQSRKERKLLFVLSGYNHTTHSWISPVIKSDVTPWDSRDDWTLVLKNQVNPSPFCLRWIQHNNVKWQCLRYEVEGYVRPTCLTLCAWNLSNIKDDLSQTILWWNKWQILLSLLACRITKQIKYMEKTWECLMGVGLKCLIHSFWV